MNQEHKENCGRKSRLFLHRLVRVGLFGEATFEPEIPLPEGRAREPTFNMEERNI